MFIVMALVLVELALVKPESGGLARYPLYTNGALVASMIGWSIWLSNASNPPTESAGIVQYLSKFMPGVYNGTSLTSSGILLAIGFMVIFVVVNYFGVQFYAKINSVVTGLKLIVPVITLIAFIIAGFHPSNFTEHGGFAPYGWPAALGAIATSGIIFAYTGFESAINLAGEAVNPRKDIPKAVILAIVLAMVIYVGLQIVFVGAVPQKFLGSGWHGVNFNSRFADLALSVNLTWLYWMLMADSMISPAGSSFVFTAYNSRQAYGLAKNRYFPTYFGKVNERWGVPTRALILNHSSRIVVPSAS